MTVVVRLLDSREPREWTSELERFGARADVYFGPGYHRAYDDNGDGTARCAVARDGEARLVVPYLECPLPEAFGAGFDVQGAYGYGGPLVDGPLDFVPRAWAAVERAWIVEGGIAAFLRLHPLEDQRGWLSQGWSIVDDRPTVSVDLHGGAARAFASPRSANHRNMVARAARLGLVVDRGPLAPAGALSFGELYAETMQRLGAAASYRFGAAYFRSLADGLGERLELFTVRRADGHAEGMALAMWGPRWGHYHLSARTADSDNCGTNLLLQALAEAGAERGLELLHLGGGRTAAADDTLLRFKERIGTAGHRFLTARRVLSPPRYEAAVDRWRNEHGQPPSWFLGYRQPCPRRGRDRAPDPSPQGSSAP